MTPSNVAVLFTALASTTMFLGTTSPATAANQSEHVTTTTATFRTFDDLRQSTLSKSTISAIVLGHSIVGDGGGGTFYRDDKAVENTAEDGGTIIITKTGHVWRRLDRGPTQAAWFGVSPAPRDQPESPQVISQRTNRLQTALNAAAGGRLEIGPGNFDVDQTLIVPGSTLVVGAGPANTYAGPHGGTVLRPYGPGQPRPWQDTGDPAKDTLRPLLVFAANNVRLENIGLLTFTDGTPERQCWDVGVLVPSVKRGAIQDVSVDGRWKVAACLLDATWSPANERMIALHDRRITPSAMNEFTAFRSFLSGKWGLMIRGVDADKLDPHKYRAEGRIEDWIWSPGGTSDIEIISCRLEGKATSATRRFDGGAFYSDAPLMNAHGGGQGHRIIGCNLRTDTKYMLKLGATHRDTFIGCYLEASSVKYQENGETRTQKPIMQNDADRSGWVRFIDCRFNNIDRKTHWTNHQTKSWP